MDRSYAWNYAHAPALPRRPGKIPPGPGGRLFDLPLGSPLGVATGALLNSRWVEAYARLGFDLLTYATVRTVARPAHALPNIVPVEMRTEAAVVRSRARADGAGTFAVSMGLPSMDPEVWRKDVRRARERLGRDQILVVSVVGTPVEGGDIEALALDYARCAEWAADAGADVVAAHLACPWPDSERDHMLFEDARAAVYVLSRVRARVSRPVIAGLGAFRSPRLLHETLTRLAPWAHGFALVHGIQRRVVDAEGRPVFEGRERGAVIAGAETYPPCARQVEEAIAWRKAGEWHRAILAVGGITSVERVRASLRVGADAALLTSAALTDPLLAFRFRQALQSAA